MVEYFDVFKFLRKKADLYNYINPFFNKKYFESHNFFYLLIALEKYKHYFDNLYLNVDSNIKLDINQRIAILTNAKNELIIAGAGSGKTTTIAAKIKYMVDILRINPKEMLLLSYTNEAVKEMQKIILDKFKINVKILTFHKFALLLLNHHGNILEYISFEEIIKYYNLKEKIALNIYLYLFYYLKIIDLKENAFNFRSAFNTFQDEVNKYYLERLKLKKNLKSFFFKRVSKVYFDKVKDRFCTFDFLIYKASKLEKYNTHFKYILIDEYQDISNLRFDFIKKYIKFENSHLMCVGDDWQTIFSFASSNINNILNFQKNFADAKVQKIVNTYRNSQELIDIAGNFIMKNDEQIKKKLKSKKHIVNPIEFVEYKNKKDFVNKLSFLIESIINYKIAFLTRYKKDINNIIDNERFKFKNSEIIYNNKKKIKYYTIHTSKGLGFDYVFLINNKKGRYGFPSNRKEKSIFIGENYILEERRLFYVALTRTKNKIYLMHPNKKYSLFLKESKKMLKKN